MRKKKATGVMGYLMLFLIAMIMVIMTFYMFASAKFMTIQHDIDDALADAVLASLVADDAYYFETYEGRRRGILKFKDTDESYRIYLDVLNGAIGSEDYFYKNVTYPIFICYEVEDDVITVITYEENGRKTVSYAEAGEVYTPSGQPVTRTSAYGKVEFELESLIGGERLLKSRDLYCTLKTDD